MMFLVVFLLFCVVESPLSPQSLTAKKRLKRKMKVDVCLLRCWWNSTNSERKHPGFCLSWRGRNPSRQTVAMTEENNRPNPWAGEKLKESNEEPNTKKSPTASVSGDLRLLAALLRLCPISWICLHSQATFLYFPPHHLPNSVWESKGSLMWNPPKDGATARKRDWWFT